MDNLLNYTVRSREVGDLLAMLRTGRLLINPYFQRNLVWREAHKHDFIQTVLLGYPIPQVFLARGPVDLERMEAKTCVVDGQQRLNALRLFSRNELIVEGRRFSELNANEKTAFIKYEVPVIDFDLDAGDSRLKDVFKRLNRTFYSLSIIERLATEYSSSDFLLTARTLCGDLASPEVVAEEEQASADVLDDRDLGGNLDAEPHPFARDPGITEEHWGWYQDRANGDCARMLSSTPVFTPYEFQRKIPLMFMLNVMSTVFLGNYYGRNDRVKPNLEDFAQEFLPAQALMDTLNSAARVIFELDMNPKSMWWNKSNFFTLLCELSFNNVASNIDLTRVREELNAFENAIPRDYQVAAREAVNNRSERITRGEAVRSILAVD